MREMADASRMHVVAKKNLALLMQLCLTNHSVPENYMLDKYKRRKGQQQVASWIGRSRLIASLMWGTRFGFKLGVI
jgi:hypothetical protein